MLDALENGSFSWSIKVTLIDYTLHLLEAKEGKKKLKAVFWGGLWLWLSIFILCLLPV